MTISYNDKERLSKSTSIKDRICAVLLGKGGILPIDELQLILQKQGVLPYSPEKPHQIYTMRNTAADKRARYLLLHHIRESYYLSRSMKGGIVRLHPNGKDDERLWSNPFDAPDLTAFVFSILTVKHTDNMTFKECIPYMREYIARKENETHELCQGKGILTNENLFYTIKKQVNHYLRAKGII